MGLALQRKGGRLGQTVAPLGLLQAHRCACWTMLVFISMGKDRPSKLPHLLKRTAAYPPEPPAPFGLSQASWTAR